MTMAWHEGGCGCGEVRYRVAGDPIMVNNCHCTRCQQQTGGTSVVNAFYESERIELLSGAMSEHQLTGGSGAAHTLCRCKACGTAILSYYAGFGRLAAGVRVATLDDRARLRPDAVIYVADAMPWVAFPADIPRFDTTYRPKDLLPPERLDRLMALAARRKAGER